jgi:threonine-phosphate decarboxylase
MDIYRASEQLKVPVRRIIDFSVPVNPLGPSKKVKAELRKHLKDLKRYPDNDCRRIKKHLARFHGVKPENIIVGSGTVELIHIVLSALKPQKIALPAPACSLNEEALETYKQTGHDVSVEYVISSEDHAFAPDPSVFSDTLKKNDVAILCNPGYPVGHVVSRDNIMKIAEEARKSGCLLIVDESFIECVPDETVIDTPASEQGMIVLRSMAGFHALAGLGIAYAVTNEHLIGQILLFSPRWPVNSLAQRAAVIALKDKIYRKETLALLQEEKVYLEKELGKIGVTFYPSSVNYYLLKVTSSEGLYDYLLKRYILVRKCDDIKGLGMDYIGIAVNNHRENTVLIKALRYYYHQSD